MTYNPDKHHRRSIRLQRYDYSEAGAYFITICTQNRECLFGELMDNRMQLNDVGRIVESVWDDLPKHYSHCTLDRMAIMPNHVHAIIVLSPVGAGFKPAPTTAPALRHGLPEIVRAWKTFSSRQINKIRQTPGVKLWQRNYYEHILRNDDEMNRIRQYIIDNPARWNTDRENPEAVRQAVTIKRDFEGVGV